MFVFSKNVRQTSNFANIKHRDVVSILNGVVCKYPFDPFASMNMQNWKKHSEVAGLLRPRTCRVKCFLWVWGRMFLLFLLFLVILRMHFSCQDFKKIRKWRTIYLQVARRTGRIVAQNHHSLSHKRHGLVAPGLWPLWGFFFCWAVKLENEFARIHQHDHQLLPIDSEKEEPNILFGYEAMEAFGELTGDEEPAPVYCHQFKMDIGE